MVCSSIRLEIRHLEDSQNRQGRPLNTAHKQFVCYSIGIALDRRKIPAFVFNKLQQYVHG